LLVSLGPRGRLCAHRIDHDLTRLRNSKAGANVGVEIGYEHLDPPGAKSLGEPTTCADARRGVRVAKGDDEAALGSAAPERDELQRVPRDLVELCSPQPPLMGEYLHEDRLIRRNAIHIHARPTIESQRLRCQLNTNGSRHGVADQRLGAPLLMRIALMCRR
jgi:hypothetical protein